MQRQSKQFLKGFFLAPLLLPFLWISFIVVIDPFWFFGSPLIKGINEHKIWYTRQVRMAKAQQFCTIKPQAAVFGSSRVEQGFLMDHPIWEQLGRSFNGGLGGIMIDEIYQYMRHGYYASGGELKTVIVGLDFFAFNALRQPVSMRELEPFFKPDRMLTSPEESCRKSFRYDADFIVGTKALRSALTTIPDQQLMNNGKPEYYLAKGGRTPKLNQLEISAEITPFRAKVEGEILGYLMNIWRPMGISHYCATTPEFDSYASFRSLVRFAVEHDIALQLFFAPKHAWMTVGLYEGGLYSQYEEFKRTVAKIVDEERARVKNAHVTLWDFAGFNPITTRPVTDAKDPWYYEVNHYRPELGNLMLDCMFGTEVAGREHKRGFCKTVNAKTIHANIESNRAALFRYMSANAETLKPLKRQIDELFAKDPGSNCGPTYRFLQGAAKDIEKASHDQHALDDITRKAEAIYEQEKRDHVRTGMRFREPHPSQVIGLKLAQTLEASGKLEQAFAAYDRYYAKRTIPDSMLQHLAELGAKHDLTERAIASYRTLVERHPDNPTYHYQLTQSYMHAKRWQEAIHHSNIGIELLPTNVEFRMFRGEAYIRVGEREKGAADLQYVIDSGINNGHIRALLSGKF